MINRKENYTPEQWERRLAMGRANYRKHRKKNLALKRASFKKSRAKYKRLLRLGLVKRRETDCSEYNTWRGMIKRCYLPSSRQFRDYGARGIRVCARWRKSYKNFLADMGRRPPGLELDRKNNNGNYTKANCRWTTTVQNMRNRRCTWRVRFRGETKCLAEWSAETGIAYATIQSRLNKGWPPKRALTTKVPRKTA